MLPPINTLEGGISLKTNQTHKGAKIVSVNISNPIVTDFVVLEPIVMHIKPNVSWGTPNKKPIRISLLEKLNESTIINEYKTLKIEAYQMAGTKSKLAFFLTIMTNIEKLIGIVNATKFPNNVPEEIESPIITVMPNMAKIIESRPIIEIFSFK